MIKGLGTALVTPFDANGTVDYEALARLLDTQLTGFVDYLVVLGTTGEAATLTTEEKKEVRQFIVLYVHTHPAPSLEGRVGVGFVIASATHFVASAGHCKWPNNQGTSCSADRSRRP